MSGLLILLVASFLVDEPLPAPAAKPAVSREAKQIGELLPAPKKQAPSDSTTRLISSTNQPPPSAPIATGTPTGEAKVGWGVDPSDNSMYMVIQIAPSAIETFAAGQRGQELTSRIPPMLRNRIEKVIVRFGTGPVEQFPSESELASMPLSQSNINQTPQIANLDRRTPVTIDAPRGSDVIPTASTTQIPIVPGGPVPSTVSPNTYATSPSVTSPPPVWNNNNVPASRPTGATSTNDGFAPSNRVVPQSLLPFSTTARPTTPYPSTTSYPSTPSAQGNVTYSGTNYSGNNYGNTTPYGNNNQYGNNTYGSGSAGGNIPLVASNPNSGIYPPGSNPILPNGSPNVGNINPPNLPTAYQNPNFQNPNYGIPVSTSGPTYATQGSISNPPGVQAQGPILPPPNLLPSTTSGTNHGGGWRLPPRDELDDGRNVLTSTRPGSWVPFFLVLSFILNVYFGLWLNHLSTKYRHLLANARGLSMPELERA